MNKLLIYTAGMTGAQLELISKESSFYCIRHNLPAITQEILAEQILSVKYGEKVSSLSLEHMFEKRALREAAHTVLSRVLMPQIVIKQIAVSPRDNAKDFITNSHQELQNNMSILALQNRMCVSLAGRVAQIHKYGQADGTDMEASSDLKQATKDAYMAIAYFGMDEEVGYINLNGILSNSRSYAPETLVTARREFEDITYAMGKPKESVTWFENDDSWKLELEEFVDAIEKRREIEHGTIFDGLRALGLVEKVYAKSEFYA